MVPFLKRLREFFHFLCGMFFINKRLVVAVWKLTKLHKPSVTIFGGSRLDSESEYAKHAEELAYVLSKQGFSIVTGGGPGIMEAANMGSYKARNEPEKEGTSRLPTDSFGIGLTNLNRESKNKYVQEYMELKYFFERKWLLVRSAIGFAVFPGGFGTMDELFEIITLMQTNRMPRAPIVLFGSRYWKPIVDWINDSASKNRMIDPEDVKLICVTDSVEEAASVICDKAYKRMRNKSSGLCR